MLQTTCVIRKVAGLDQYIPMSDAFCFEVGERTFTGTFNTEIEHDGPSKSHARTICLPVGQLSISTLNQSDIDALRRR